MKKITLASFVFMVMLVTGVSALIIGDGNLESVTTTDNKNSEKAKDDFDKASDALVILEDSNTSGSDKCYAYAKVQRYCEAILDYDDDSSDKDDDSSDGDSNSDALSDDNVSDYKSKVQKLLDDADKAMKMCMMGKKKLNCDKEIECQEMKSKFLYNLSDDDSSRIKFKAHCGDHGSHDDDSSSHDGESH